MTDENQQPDAAADPTISSPMVGRDSELQLLRRYLGRLRRGEGAIVSLIGEAGIGKSRLVHEALATDEAKSARLMIGRSLSVGRTLSFHPFIDLLRGWAGIAGGADDEEAMTRLDEAVRAACGDDADETLPFIATLMGLRLSGAAAERVHGIEGEALERLIFSSMRTLFIRLAQAQPLVVFFEDLHWADRSSVQLLEQLLRLICESPILFVQAFRPDYAETGEHLLGVARTQYPLQHREIRLHPLAGAQCGELVGNLLRSEHVPASTLQLITEKAEGNPFFIEEVIRSLIDAGKIAMRDGQPQVETAIEGVAVPGNVRDVIMARLSHLDRADREVLQVAAVIGRGFYGRVIADVMRDVADLAPRLQSLKQRGLLSERRTRRTASHARRTFVQEVEYVFQHALVQETIYAALPESARRDLHGRVAETIETLFADRLSDFFGMLAYHYGRAERLEKAEQYLFQAGEEAARAAASREALSFFQDASRVYLQLHGHAGDPAKQAVLERNIGLALMNTGRLTEAMPHFDQALAHLGDPVPQNMASALLQFAGDAVAVAARLLLPSTMFSSTRDRTRYGDNLQVRYPRIKAQSTTNPTRLVFDYTRAVRLLNQTDPIAVPDQTIGLYSGFAAMFAYSGLSFRLGRRYLALADGLRRPGHAKDLFDHHCLVCICNYLEGVWDDAHGTVDDEVVMQALRYGGLWEVNTYLGLDADRRLRRGDFSGARRRFDQLADNGERYGFEFARTNRAGESMMLLIEERQLDAALDAANLYHASIQDDPLRVLALGSKAKTQVLLGDLDGAAHTLAAAERVTAAAPIIPPWHMSAHAVGALHHDLARLEATPNVAELVTRAGRSARAARRLARRVAVQRGEIYRLLARHEFLLRNRDGAARWLTAALVECNRLGALPELARAHLDAFTLDIDLHDGRRRDDHLARADELFNALGIPGEGTTQATPIRRAA